MVNTTTTFVGSVALAVRTLRDLGMPRAEIDRILATSDPRVIRRYVDLHIERLEERLADARTTLIGLEPVLEAAISKRRSLAPPEILPSIQVGGDVWALAIAAHR